MKIQSRKQESGQIIIIMAVAFVALLGFAALAIDTGTIYADRRYDQSVVDASALAGAAIAAQSMDNYGVMLGNFTCGASGVLATWADAEDAAIARAADNNFVIDTDITDKLGVEVTCGNEDLGAVKKKYIDVKVVITSKVNTAFAHLVFPGAVHNTVESITRVYPRAPFASGFAISSTSEDCGESLYFDGDSTVIVHNSGVHSNSCLTTNGGIEVEATGPTAGIFYNDTLKINGGGVLTPAASQTSITLPTQEPVRLDCTFADMTVKSSTSGGSITPGIYSQIKLNAGNTLNLAPGLYCLDGDLKATGGTLTGNNVTIYLRNGDFDIGGNVTVNLAAPTSDAYEPARKGLLIYADPSNDAVVNVLGGASSSYVGTIYVPSGELGVGGNSGINPTYNTQLIAYTIKVHGTSDIDIWFDEALAANNPPMIDLLK